MPEINVLVEAGKATASAPLGPALGPMGVNIGDVVAEINEKTKQFDGVKIPVKVVVDSGTKTFEIKVGSPPTSALIKKEISLKKGAANPKTEQVGNLTMEQVKKLAEMKLDGSMATSLKAVAKEVIGACQSMGVTIDSKKALQVQKEIAEGKHDAVLGEN